jgi:polyisoprenyl-teichoic acid--peptidoglycan teichoic acid transferase
VRTVKPNPYPTREPVAGPQAVPIAARPGAGVRPSTVAGLKPRAHRPWYTRKRLWFPLTILLSFAFGLGALVWNIPIVDKFTGKKITWGKQLMVMTQGVLNKRTLPEAFNGAHQVRVLFAGLDHVPERGVEDPPHRSDSVMVAAVDFDTKQVRVVSVPRDGWVMHYENGVEKGYDKLAHSYALGGIKRTQETVQNLLGIDPIDYYVTIKFEGLAKVVDALGGLDIDVDKNMNYDDNHGNLHIHIKKGMQHLNGQEVVGYARFRHDTFGDITRMGRQQKVIKLMIEKIQQPENMMRLPYFMKTIGECVETNLTMDQLMVLAENAKLFTPDCIQTTTLNSYGNHDPHFPITLRGCPRGMAAQGIMPADIEVARGFLQNLAVPSPPAEPAQTGDEAGDGASSAGDKPAGE